MVLVLDGGFDDNDEDVLLLPIGPVCCCTCPCPISVELLPSITEVMKVSGGITSVPKFPVNCDVELDGGGEGLVFCVGIFIDEGGEGIVFKLPLPSRLVEGSTCSQMPLGLLLKPFGHLRSPACGITVSQLPLGLS